MKYFSPIAAKCGGCSQTCDVLTATRWILCEPEMCMPGDLVRCTACECRGWIAIDEADEAYVAWPMDICAPCHRFYEERIRVVTRKVVSKLKDWGLYDGKTVEPEFG